MQLFTDMINGTIKLVSLSEGETISQGELRGAVIATNIANTIATSMYTRKRVAQGQDPVIKVLF